VAQESRIVDSVRRELDDLVALVQATPPLQRLLERPDLPAERKFAALSAALSGAFSETVLAMLRVLLQHGRGGEIPELAQSYDALADEAQDIVRAEARSVLPLTREERARLLATLTRLTGKHVLLTERIDPGVLAGVSVQVGDRLIDGSASGRLARMREELIGQRG
jgi:F-type H+-transporting ATPase subunit delta